MNKHPLETINQIISKKRLSIREAIRFVDGHSYQLNTRLVTVIFPASVEIITYYAFKECFKLEYIIYRWKSRLGRIGNYAFSETKLKKIDFPSTVEELEISCFNKCLYLNFITFQDDSKIKSLGVDSFVRTNIESFDIIDTRSFSLAKNLELFSFPKNS